MQRHAVQQIQKKVLTSILNQDVKIALRDSGSNINDVYFCALE